MKKPVFSLTTDNLPQRQVFSAWRDAMRHAGVTGDVTTPQPDVFMGSVVQYELGYNCVDFWHNTAATYSRTPIDCAREVDQFYSLCYVSGGGAAVTQHGQTLEAKQGDTFLLNFGAPSKFQISESLSIKTLHLQREQVNKWLPCADDAVVRRLQTASSWGSVLSAMMSAMTPQTLSYLDAAPVSMVEQVGSFLSLCADHRAPVTGRYQACLLQRLQKSIRERFHEPDLSPAILASVEGISKRTLHSIFAVANSSFGRELLSTRMENARLLLRNPGFARHSVAEISSLVGFTHPGHFTTRFRQSFGVTPLQFRKMCNAG